MINIQFFVYPMFTMFNPALYGDFTGLNKLTWIFSFIFFNQKMMAIFSMLFGAGLVLMYNRAQEKGVTFGKIYYRRLLWLLVIGLIHAYLIWSGDILVSYALCGLLLYPVRKLKGKWLLTIGGLVLACGVTLMLLTGFMFNYMREQHKIVEESKEQGTEPTDLQKTMALNWEMVTESMSPDEAALQKEIAAMRGSYLDVISYQAPFVIMMQTQTLLFFIGWRVLGLMLLGMGLMKLDVFSLGRSTRFYILMAVFGYAAGFTLTGLGTSAALEHGFDLVKYFQSDGVLEYIGSIGVSLGHIGVLMLICRFAVLKGITERLAAVGRMAFSNYLSQSIMMTFVFHGWGLGLFGSVDRFTQLGFVLGVWIIQLLWSPIWLKHFKYGPAEWLWRSLTYGKMQPFRRSARTDVALET